MTDLKAFMQTLELRRLRTALETDPDSGDTKLVLVRVPVPGRHSLIHPSDFLSRLEKNSMTIDPVTLVIAASASSPPVEKKSKPKPSAPKPTKQDAPASWSKPELEALSYNELRKVSKDYDDVPGNLSKADIIKKLTGKAKA